MKRKLVRLPKKGYRLIGSYVIHGVDFNIYYKLNTDFENLYVAVDKAFVIRFTASEIASSQTNNFKALSWEGHDNNVG